MNYTEKLRQALCMPQFFALIKIIWLYEHKLWNNKAGTLVLLSKKSESHVNVDIEFGEGEVKLSLKKVEKRAETRKPKEKVTYKVMQDFMCYS